jgi:hypothetical protein
MPYQSLDTAIAQADQLVRQFTVLFHLADTYEITDLSAIRDSAGRGLLMAERHAEALRNQKKGS